MNRTTNKLLRASRKTPALGAAALTVGIAKDLAARAVTGNTPRCEVCGERLTLAAAFAAQSRCPRCREVA